MRSPTWTSPPRKAAAERLLGRSFSKRPAQWCARVLLSVAASATHAQQQTTDSLLQLEAYDRFPNSVPVRTFNANDSLRTSARPVCLLTTRFTTLERNHPDQYCTCFLIGEEVILTNHHCLISKQVPTLQATRGKATFDFLDEADSRDAKTFTVDVRNPLARSEKTKLDYAALKVDGRPGLTFGYYKLDTETDWDNRVLADAFGGRRLRVYHHQSGGDLRVSELCAFRPPVVIPYLDGTVEPPVAYARITHNCATDDGSSGGPVIMPDDGTVVGIHQASKEDAFEVKLAIPVSAVLRDSRGRIRQSRVAGSAPQIAIEPQAAPHLEDAVSLEQCLNEAIQTPSRDARVAGRLLCISAWTTKAGTT